MKLYVHKPLSRMVKSYRNNSKINFSLWGNVSLGGAIWSPLRRHCTKPCLGAALDLSRCCPRSHRGRLLDLCPLVDEKDHQSPLTDKLEHHPALFEQALFDISKLHIHLVLLRRFSNKLFGLDGILRAHRRDHCLSSLWDLNALGSKEASYYMRRG